MFTREQVAAILAAPSPDTWSGHRDRALLATAYNTGARVSELTALRVRDVLLQRQLAVHLHGKGRKERVIPLWKNTAAELRGWFNRTNAQPDTPTFPNRNGAAMSRSGVRDRLDRAVAAARRNCASLCDLRITPHTLRHFLSALWQCRDSLREWTIRPLPPNQLPPRCCLSDHGRTLTRVLGLDHDGKQHEPHRTRRVRAEGTPPPCTCCSRVRTSL